MTPEEFELKVKPHIEGLFSGKYDIVVNPTDGGDPINYSTVIRTLVNAVNNLVNDNYQNKKRKIE